ncbi:MAG TPA: formyltransferase family protein [Polyangiaceae bacterium]|nr:formyltransferase family protein [Polyangiaceae bacterium]
MIRIAYFGLPLGALLLHADGLPPALVVLAPPEAPGRRRLARSLSADVLDAQLVDDAEALEAAFVERLEREPPDLLVSWYWTRRLPERALRSARLGAIGVHPSLLPRHRGPNPFFAAIDAGDAVTGVTVHRLVHEYDAGAVLARETIPVAERNAWQLARALDRPGLRTLRRVVRAFAEGNPPPDVPQDPSKATLAPEPDGELLHADFSWPAERVVRRIRALSPVPGLALEIGGIRFFATDARVTSRVVPSLRPGEAARTAEGVAIRAGDAGVLILRAQISGQAEEDEDGVVLSAAELAEHLGLPPTGI